MKKLLLLLFITSLTSEEVFGGEAKQLFPISQLETATKSLTSHPLVQPDFFKKENLKIFEHRLKVCKKDINTFYEYWHVVNYQKACIKASVLTAFMQHSETIEALQLLLKAGASTEIQIAHPTIHNVYTLLTPLAFIASTSFESKLNRIQLLNFFLKHQSVESGTFHYIHNPNTGQIKPFHCSPLTICATHAFSNIELYSKIAAILLSAGASKEKAMYEENKIISKLQEYEYESNAHHERASLFLESKELDKAVVRETVKKRGFKNVTHYLMARQRGLTR